MQSATSVSKGVFVFKNGFKVPQKNPKKKRVEVVPNIFGSELWYRVYKRQWDLIENKIQVLNNENYSNVLSSLIQYIKTAHDGPVEYIPSATLLMGINMPDHSDQFLALSKQLKSNVTKHVAILQSQDCITVKNLMENLISQFVNHEEDDENCDCDTHITIKKSMCTMSLLRAWYEKLYGQVDAMEVDTKEVLVVILPEFESFKDSSMQDFIEIINNYIHSLPFVLIFGVSTSVSAIHKSMPYHITSKLNIQIFNSQSSTDYLNSVLENVILTETCPFHLGGKVFTLFCDIFLFYDFSVKGFIQNFKFAMLEHYSANSATALCTSDNFLVDSFEHEDFENIRHLMSFRKYVESQDYKTRISLIEDDKFFKAALKNELKQFQHYLFVFHNLLKVLHILVRDLPKSPLGKQLREIYCFAVTSNITQSTEYKECIQLLNFLSKDELVTRLSLIITSLQNVSKNSTLANISSILEEHLDLIQQSNFQYETKTKSKLNAVTGRAQLKENLLKMSKESRTQNNYEKARENFLLKITEVFEVDLCEPASKPFHEIYFFNDVSAVKRHVIGSHRAGVHMALNNPQNYLQCECCSLPNETSIVPSLPDISVAYKLHLECGRLINMYDWLQAFAAIVGSSDKDRTVDEYLQARFTRAVTELEFLGFVKSSKRKTDHVTRLTWGGC